MLLDQIEYVASKGTVSAEEFYIEYGTYIDIVPLNKAKEFIIVRWTKFMVDGKDRRFKVVPIKYWCLIHYPFPPRTFVVAALIWGRILNLIS